MLAGTSLGGMVLKAAFIQLIHYQPEIAAACKGIIFMMVPHAGSDKTSLLPWLGLIKLASVSPLAQELKIGSRAVALLQQDFDDSMQILRKAGHDIPILAVIETKFKGTVISGVRKRSCSFATPI